MKRILSWGLVFVMVLTALAACVPTASAASETYTSPEGFEYVLYLDSYKVRARIIGYKGNAENLVIDKVAPSHLETEEIVGKIDPDVFAGNKKLKSVTIGAGIIDDNAFKGCTSLTTVKLTENVKTIGKSAFQDCSSLSKVYIDASITKFDYDPAKTVVSGVNEIKSKAFANCPKLKYLYYLEDSHAWKSLKIASDALGKNTLPYYSYKEETIAFASFKNVDNETFEILSGGELRKIYDGKVYKPEIQASNNHGVPVNSSEYTVTYEGDFKSLYKQHYVLVAFKNNPEKRKQQRLMFEYTLDKTKQVEMEGNNKRITISWEKILGATHYAVFLYDEESKSYKSCLWPDGNIENTALSYTFTDLTPGKAYKIKICGFWNLNGKSGNTEQNTECTFTVPTTDKTVKKVLVGTKNTTTTKTATATKTTTAKTATTTKTTTAAPKATTTTTASTTTATEAAGPSETKTVATTQASVTATTATTAVTETKAEPQNSSWLWIALGSSGIVLLIIGVAYVLLKKRKKI